MGIGHHLAQVIVREHLRRPLPPEVFTIGQAFTGFTYEEALDIFRRADCKPLPVSIEYDNKTTEAHQRASTGTKFLSSATFFKMMGVHKVSVIDINPYEQADLLLDLTQPIPETMEGSADFVVGGSVLDNIFDPAQYIKNMARLLRAGGRLVEINIFVNKYRPYMLLPAAWFMDYFVVNRFARSNVFVLEYSTAAHLYELRIPFNPNQQPGWGLIENFEFDDKSVINHIVIAEKGVESTWSHVPVQDAYRNKAEVEAFNENLRRILDAPHLNLGLQPGKAAPANLEQNKGHYEYVGCFES